MNEFRSAEVDLKVDVSKNFFPENYSPGRGKYFILLWLIVQSTLFNLLPRPFYGWRCFLLKLFGAKIGRNVRIRPNVIIEFPWRLTIGNNTSIGDHVWIYSLAEISLGSNCVISQYSKLVTGSHNPKSKTFNLIVAPIRIGDSSWVSANSFIGPGVTLGEGVVIGACSKVFKDIPPWKIYCGANAVSIRERILDK